MPDPSMDTGNSAAADALIFVSDASAEAERLTASLRTRGYVVVDVPLTLLVSRVGVQSPALVLCDADAPSALEAIERMREIPAGGKVDVLFLGEPARTLHDHRERIARQSSGLFTRPVDVYALLRKVEALIGPPRSPATRPSNAPQGNRAPVLVAATRRPYRYDTRARARNLPSPLFSTPPRRPPSEPPSVSFRPPPVPSAIPLDLVASADSELSGLSPDLEALLGRAEQRVAESRAFSPPTERLSPEEELLAVLPPDLLSSLDEPLDELDDEDEDDAGTPGTHGSESSHAAPAESRTGQESAAGTSPGGSVNPFAPKEATTSGGDREAEAEPKSREGAPTTPPAMRGRTAPPSHAGGTHTGLENTGFGTLPPSRVLVDGPLELPPAERLARDPRAPEPGELSTGEPETPRQQASTKPPRARLDPPEAPGPMPVAASGDVEIPNTLRSGDAVRVLARAVRARYSGAIAFEDDAGIRRVVLRDGDFVTAAAGIDNEALTAFLAQRGDLALDVAQRLGRKLPQFGRHAGAALIAQGHLRQEDLWPVLRAHAEWLITRIVSLERGVASLERVVPPRLSSEPSVFGGATGAEVLIEVVRRAISPVDALAFLGGPEAHLVPGEADSLLAECALADAELALVRAAGSSSLGELLERAGSQDVATVFFTLVELSVLKARSTGRRARPQRRAPTDALDHDAVRARIRARRALVDEGDYFALLGVGRSSTSYDIRRAYTTLRQEYDPSRILTPLTADLQDDVDVILEVLDEAYEILRDPVRRERYRRALEDTPDD